MKKYFVIPAQAGIQLAKIVMKFVSWSSKSQPYNFNWIPAFAGMTVITLMFFYIPLVSAEQATESGLLQKLDQLKTEIASKAAQIKNDITKKVQNKAFIGTIVNIGSTEITLQTLHAAKTIKYDEFTEVIGAKNKKIKIDTLEPDDKIVALGDMDDKNNLVAQRLIYLDNFASSSAVLVWGQIQKTTGPTITIKDKSGNTINLLTNSQTQFFLGNSEASIADSKVEQKLLARGTQLKDGSIRPRFIYFIPSMGFTKPIEKPSSLPKLSTPSASPKR